VRGDRVVVTSNPGVSVFTTSGKLLSVWGNMGNGPEQFMTPHGAAIADDGTVYVCDSMNLRIKAYKPDGTLLWIWPKERSVAAKTGLQPKSGSLPLQVPTGLTLDGRGRIVIADAFSFDLVVLQPSKTGATLVGRYGAFGQADGQFVYPSGLTYDPVRDWFVVADTGNDRLQVVRIPGSAAPGLLAAARRATADISPWCLVPLGLLVLAAVLYVMRRRMRDAGAGPEARPAGEEESD
jgi:sugar lactone lactonase YvrE